ALADAFEQAWRSDTPPRIEDYFQRVDKSLRPAALRELLKVEIELRLDQKDPAKLSEYLEQFPGLEVVVRDAFQESKVAQLHPHAKQQVDGNLDSRETITFAAEDSVSQEARLEIRCPSCHAPIQMAVDTALTDLTCGSCGSHFSLIDENAA